MKYFEVGHKLCSENGVRKDWVIIERDGDKARICMAEGAWYFFYGSPEERERGLIRSFATWVDVANLIPDYGYLGGKPDKAFYFHCPRKNVVMGAEQYKGQTQVVKYTAGVFSAGMCPVEWKEARRIVRGAQVLDMLIQLWLKTAKARNAGLYPNNYQVLTMKVLEAQINFGALLRMKGTTTGKDKVDVLVLHCVPYANKGDVVKVFGNYEGRRFVAEAVSNSAMDAKYRGGKPEFHVYRKWERLTPEQIAPYEPFMDVVSRCDGEIYIPAGMK